MQMIMRAAAYGRISVACVREYVFGRKWGGVSAPEGNRSI